MSPRQLAILAWALRWEGWWADGWIGYVEPFIARTFPG